MNLSSDQPDVLVLGTHPCALLAATTLLQPAASRKLRVQHAMIPGEPAPRRLVLINPELFKLHEQLKPLARKIRTSPIHGIRFVGDTADQTSEYRSRSPEALVAGEEDLRQAMSRWAQEHGVRSRQPAMMKISSVDERGVELSLDGEPMRPRMLIVAGELPPEQRKLLAIPDSPEPETLYEYSYVVVPAEEVRDPASQAAPASRRAMMVMSLNLADTYAWAWMFAHDDHVHLACSAGVARGQPNPETVAAAAAADDDQPANSRRRNGAELLGAWINTLKRHGQVREDARVDLARTQTMRIAQAGALAQEGVASRTLLIGPAGGFYSACAEDVYPCCWSALFACDVARKALHEPHLQDALGAFRHKWRTTLGEYLRGPQQNLRFLLPLVYRNPVMTTRLAESILSGKSVVR